MLVNLVNVKVGGSGWPPRAKAQRTLPSNLARPATSAEVRRIDVRSTAADPERYYCLGKHRYFGVSATSKPWLKCSK